MNENDDERAATRSPSICASAFRISSARPSPKNSLSGSALRLVNGSTAIDGPPVAAGAAPVPPSRAWWTSAIEEKRDAALFSRQRAMTPASSAGTVARRVLGGAGVSWRTADAISIVDRPVNGRTPVTIS